MGSGTAALAVRFISCPCSAVLDLKPLFAKFRESQVLQVTSGAALGELTCLTEGPPTYVLPVDKDLLGFLVVAANTSHLETGTVCFCFPC